MQSNHSNHARQRSLSPNRNNGIDKLSKHLSHIKSQRQNATQSFYSRYYQHHLDEDVPADITERSPSPKGKTEGEAAVTQSKNSAQKSNKHAIKTTDLSIQTDIALSDLATTAAPLSTLSSTGQQSFSMLQLQNRLQSTVKLLSDSLEEQGRLRAIMEVMMKTNYNTTSSHQEDTDSNDSRTIVDVLLEQLTTSVSSQQAQRFYYEQHASQLTLDQLVEQVIHLRTSLDQAKHRIDSLVSELKVTKDLLQEAQMNVNELTAAATIATKSYHPTTSSSSSSSTTKPPRSPKSSSNSGTNKYHRLNESDSYQKDSWNDIFADTDNNSNSNCKTYPTTLPSSKNNQPTTNHRNKQQHEMTMLPLPPPEDDPPPLEEEDEEQHEQEEEDTDLLDALDGSSHSGSVVDSNNDEGEGDPIPNREEAELSEGMITMKSSDKLSREREGDGGYLQQLDDNSNNNNNNNSRISFISTYTDEPGDDGVKFQMSRISSNGKQVEGKASFLEQVFPNVIHQLQQRQSSHQQHSQQQNLHYSANDTEDEEEPEDQVLLVESSEEDNAHSKADVDRKKCKNPLKVMSKQKQSNKDPSSSSHDNAEAANQEAKTSSPLPGQTKGRQAISRAGRSPPLVVSQQLPEADIDREEEEEEEVDNEPKFILTIDLAANDGSQQQRVDHVKIKADSEAMSLAFEFIERNQLPLSSYLEPLFKKIVEIQTTVLGVQQQALPPEDDDDLDLDVDDQESDNNDLWQQPSLPPPKVEMNIVDKFSSPSTQKDAKRKASILVSTSQDNHGTSNSNLNWEAAIFAQLDDHWLTKKHPSIYDNHPAVEDDNKDDNKDYEVDDKEEDIGDEGDIELEDDDNDEEEEEEDAQPSINQQISNQHHQQHHPPPHQRQTAQARRAQSMILPNISPITVGSSSGRDNRNKKNNNSNSNSKDTPLEAIVTDLPFDEEADEDADEEEDYLYEENDLSMMPLPPPSDEELDDDEEDEEDEYNNDNDDLYENVDDIVPQQTPVIKSSNLNNNQTKLLGLSLTASSISSPPPPPPPLSDEEDDDIDSIYEQEDDAYYEKEDDDGYGHQPPPRRQQRSAATSSSSSSSSARSMCQTNAFAPGDNKRRTNAFTPPNRRDSLSLSPSSPPLPMIYHSNSNSSPIRSPFAADKSLSREEIYEVVEVAEGVLDCARKLREEGYTDYAGSLYKNALTLMKITEYEDIENVKEEAKPYSGGMEL